MVSLRGRLRNTSPRWCATRPMWNGPTRQVDMITITCPRTSPMTRSTGCANRRPMRRKSPSSCIGHRAHRTVRIRCQRSGPTSTKANSTTAGTSIASGPLLARSRWAGFRRMRSSHRVPRPWLHGTRFRRTKGRSNAGSWKSSPASRNTQIITLVGSSMRSRNRASWTTP